MEGVKRQPAGLEFSFVQNYPLPLRMPASGMGWRHNRDIGITLAADRLSWTIGDKPFGAALFWRMKHLADSNVPRDYAPDSIPASMIGAIPENPA